MAVAAWCCLPSTDALAATPWAQLRGIDFEGGGQAEFGAAKCGRQDVNYVYARPTGAAARMTVRLSMERVPRGNAFLFLDATDDDAPTQCPIRISLNGQELFRGPSGFPDSQWLSRRFPIAPGVLKVGSNELSIDNLSPEGAKGMPPWFMVARCALAGAGYAMPATTAQTPASSALEVRLPRKIRPLPEPLAAGSTKPGFQFRGTKGWGWTAEQYLEEIPTLMKYKMNFLMNCYLSMFASQPGEPWRNEWWKPMPDAKKAAYARVFSACRENGITYCFAVHPQLGSSRPLNPLSDEDIELFYQHYAWAQSQGVRWFSVSLDDVSWGTKGSGVGGTEHSRLVNAVLGRLRQKDPGAQLIFCPVPYWGDGTKPEDRAYLESVARDMDPSVYVFWTGDEVVTRRITRKAAESYKGIVKHRLFLWDNYPVNDSSPTLHLGPARGRDADLCEVIDGYMSNPMASQNQINRVPLATCADYAYNPTAYDPARSIGQAILHEAKSLAQRKVLKELVEAYPGFLVTGGGTGTSAVRGGLGALQAKSASGSAAKDFVRHLQDILERLEKEFPNQFFATKKTLRDDIQWIEQQIQGKQ